MSHIPGRVSALALLFATPAAHADEDSAARTDIVVTAAHAAQDARAAAERRPGGVDVVESDAFAARLAVSLRDALAFSPGVYTQPRFGQEVRLSVRGSGISRGYHMRGLTLLLDGVPINLADDNGDFQELDPALLQRIEVYRGSNALEYGGSTLGGAVNGVTPTGRTAPALEMRIDGGSHATVRGKVAAGYADARGDAWLGVSADRSDGDRDHAKRNALRFAGNIGLRLTDRIDTRFYATLSHIRQHLPGALTLEQALSDPAMSLPSNISGDQQRNIDSLRLQNRSTIDLDGARIAFGLFYAAKQLDHPIYQVVDQKSVDRGVFAGIDGGGRIAGMPFQWTLGTQARFGTVEAKQFLNIGGRRGLQTTDATQTARTINSYGELRLTPASGLTLVAGGIYTTGRREVDNRLNPDRSGDATFDGFAPKFGLLFAPAPDVALYMNYSRSLELPGFIELSQTPLGGLPGFAPVGLQKAWTWEIGTRGRRGVLAWDISLYRADIRGEMLQYAVSPDYPAATFNADRTRHSGIEAGIDVRLTRWAVLRQVYQLNDFRFRDDRQFANNHLPVIPRHQYRAELRLGAERLAISPNVEWQPQGAWADYANSVRVPGYAMLGIGAEADIGRGMMLFVDARNLTGKRAIGDISAVTVAGAATVAYYPVERRSVYAGLRLRL